MPTATTTKNNNSVDPHPTFNFSLITYTKHKNDCLIEFLNGNEAWDYDEAFDDFIFVVGYLEPIWAPKLKGGKITELKKLIPENAALKQSKCNRKESATSHGTIIR